MLIYNSQRSDPTSKQTQAAAPEIFCYKAVAKVTLGYTKSIVVPRAQRSKAGLIKPALQLQIHLGAMPKPPPRVCAAGERCLPELQG